MHMFHLPKYMLHSLFSLKLKDGIQMDLLPHTILSEFELRKKIHLLLDVMHLSAGSENPFPCFFLSSEPILPYQMKNEKSHRVLPILFLMFWRWLNFHCVPEQCSHQKTEIEMAEYYVHCCFQKLHTLHALWRCSLPDG